MAAGAALLRIPPLLYRCNPDTDVPFPKWRKPGFYLKRKPGGTISCQTKKEGIDGLNASVDKHESLSGSSRSDHGNDDEYNVNCHVEVISWRERRITASIVIAASIKRVWQVLTNYERLSEFIPNLIRSEIIPCPFPGRLWLLQQGMQRMMYWNIEAHVILDLKEFPLVGELHFSMVDGDFMRYDGKWCLQTGPRRHSCLLHYEVNVVPKVIFPTAFVESIIKADLPKNLCAIAKRAEAKLDLKLSNISRKDVLLQAVQTNSEADTRRMVNAGVAGSQWSGFGRTCKLGSPCLVDEIHFRRLDDLLEKGVVHRQVVASITVKASSKDVWSVLTAYEALPEFVPNLVNSVVISREGKRVRLMQEGCKCLLYMVLHARVILDLWEQPEQEISFKQVEGDFDFFQGRWTLNELGAQHTVLKYTVETKIWKDCILAESLVEEVIYEDLPSNLCAIRDKVESSANSSSSVSMEIPDLISLTESVEPSICAKLNLIEAENFDTNSKREDDRDALTHKGSSTDLSKKRMGRGPRIQGLRDDFGVLEREIRDFIAAYGSEGIMPKRQLLRKHWRTDLEKAIKAVGGFSTVAARLKLSLSYDERKPRGYWDDIQNLRNEVIAAQKETGCDPDVLPSRLSIERLGKFGLSRAYEKWGGASETARILGLVPKGSNMRKRRGKKQSGKDTVLAPNVKPYHIGVPQESVKWLTLVGDLAESDCNHKCCLLKLLKLELTCDDDAGAFQSACRLQILALRHTLSFAYIQG
ncbi:hypothetical protein GOP47_0028095 [Adiantum capillus-veneris]|nr:hypothetical protein GOP47_0028095 [Adiantum capillus-veneris]